MLKKVLEQYTNLNITCTLSEKNTLVDQDKQKQTKNSKMSCKFIWQI